MKKYIAFIFFVIVFSCSKSDDTNVSSQSNLPIINVDSEEDSTPVYADVNFSNWKITLPVDENNNGSPDEYQPTDLVNFGYQSLAPVMPFMYDDVNDSSLVFYTYPDVSTTNSSYSRTELRELINPTNSRDNWSLQQGGIMEGRLKVVDISEDNENNNRQYHNTIVMQIHGIISEEDMEAHNFSSNNGPPLIKIRWIDGFIYSYKKSLVDENTSGDDLLETSSATWVDASTNMGYVGFEEFNFKIKASTGKLELQLNDNDPLVYEDVSLSKWPFENYFKAGNYLGSTNPNAFSYVKYYNLSVTH